MHGPAARAHGLARAHAPAHAADIVSRTHCRTRSAQRAGRLGARRAVAGGRRYRVGRRIQGSRPTRCTPRPLPRGTHPHMRGSPREFAVSAPQRGSRLRRLACGARAAARHATVCTTAGPLHAEAPKDTHPNITSVKVLYYILGSSIGDISSSSSSSDGGRGSDSNGSNGSNGISSSAENEKMEAKWSNGQEQHRGTPAEGLREGKRMRKHGRGSG
jgi:hypothetical protein